MKRIVFLILSLVSIAGAQTSIRAAKINNRVYCDQIPGAAALSFDQVMNACILALPTNGPATADASNLSGTQLTMSANWTLSRSGTTAVFGQYPVVMGTHQILIPSPTSNIKFVGSTPYAGTPLTCANGTCFKFTGSTGAAAIAFGDTAATSFGFVVEDIYLDLTGSTNGAALDFVRVYGGEINRVRGAASATINSNTAIFILLNGTSTAPGGQSITIRNVVENNFQFGVVSTGGVSPPLCNNTQYIGGQFSGNGSAGSIAIDIECGNDHEFFGPYISGYDIGLKVAAASGQAVFGKIHMESCTTYGILLTAAANNNELWSDTGCTISDLGSQNSIHDPLYTSSSNFFYGSITSLGTTQANKFFSTVNIRGNAGLPAAVNGGSGGFIGVGSSTLGFWIGDGSGLNADFYKRTGSVDTLVMQFHDDGTISKYKQIATVSNGVPSIYAQVNALGNTASIATTTLYAVPSSGAGMYRVTYYVETQSAGTAGTVTLSLTWSDGLSTKTFTTGTADLTVNTLASVVSGTYIVRSAASQNISYATTVAGPTGSPSYIVYLRLEAL